VTDRVDMLLRGRMGEKFVARALQEGIRFERIDRSAPRELLLSTSASDARRIMHMAREYRLDLTVQGEAGRPLWRRKLKRRASLAAGMALCAALICMFCMRIWSVEALSLDGMTDGETLRAIERFAAQRGVSPGVLRQKIDREALASDIRLEWEELTHVAIRGTGVRLRIEVAAEERAPQVYDVSDGRDLVALRDAVVVYVEPLSGKAQVKSGDTVRRGQLLILGEERMDGGAVRRIRALGKVTARVWFEGECSLPLAQTVRERTGKRRMSSAIRLGEWSWPLVQAGDYPCQDEEEQLLPVGGLYLPLYIVRTVRWEVQEKHIPADEQALRLQGEAWALELARAQLPAGAQESAFWSEFTREGDWLRVRVTVEVQMDIAADRSELSAQ